MDDKNRKTKSKEHETPFGGKFYFDETVPYDDWDIEDKIDFAKYHKALDYYYKEFTCPECGGEMEFEDDMEDVLICKSCRFDMPYEKYGFEDEDVWDAVNNFPTYEELMSDD